VIEEGLIKQETAKDTKGFTLTEFRRLNRTGKRRRPDGFLGRLNQGVLINRETGM
jgi:hypothetical protein